MPYTSFAVAGAGPTIGGRIVQALINRGASVVALARPESTSTQSPLLQGAKITTVDYADVKMLASIFRAHNVEVVISAVRTRIRCLYRGKDGHLALKSEFAEHVKSIGIPVMRVYNGVFMEFIPWLTGVELGKFHLMGKHTAPSSFTSLDEQGERRSLASIGALYEARNPPVPVAHVAELPEGFVKQTFLQRKFEEGRLSSGWDNYLDKDVPENAGSGNKAWEGHK
ncbi:hypothetical protein V8E55_002903 [Tylopilus felleus]